jgi:hypothetical protein
MSQGEDKPSMRLSLQGVRVDRPNSEASRGMVSEDLSGISWWG